MSDPRIKNRPCACGRTDYHEIDDCTAAKELLTPREWEVLKAYVDAQLELTNEGEDTSGLVGFGDDDEGMWIIDPFGTTDMFYPVNPVHYYGKWFVESPFVVLAKVLATLL